MVVKEIVEILGSQTFLEDDRLKLRLDHRLRRHPRYLEIHTHLTHTLNVVALMKRIGILSEDCEPVVRSRQVGEHPIIPATVSQDSKL
jgi:hypothetical protein